MVRMRWRRSSRMMRIMRWMRRRRNGQCVLNSVIENKRILYETYLTSYVVYFCYLLMIYLNTLPRCGETQHAGKKHMYQWGLERRSDNIDVLRSASERSGVAPEWGRSAPEVWETQDGGNITCISGVWSVGATILMCSGALRSAPERSGVAPEWGRSAPELRSSGALEWRWS